MNKYFIAIVLAFAGLGGVYAKACGARDGGSLLPAPSYSSLMPSNQSSQPRTDVKGKGTN